MAQDQEKLVLLRQILVERFSDGELRTLSFDSGVDYQDLPGSTKQDLARELILHHVRHNSLTRLITAGTTLRPDITWQDIDFDKYGRLDLRRNNVIYDCRRETPPFESWTLFSSAGGFSRRIRVFTRPDGLAIFELVSFGNELVGVNKSLRTLAGEVHFEYKVISSDAQTPNVLFCMIPMQEPGIGRTGLIEVGTHIQDDPRNAFSPYRRRLVVPSEYIADDAWHRACITFDFREISTAFYSLFGPRINEGSLDLGQAHLLVTNIQVTI